MIAMAGYRWRTPVKVVLFNSENEAELDDDYADYLDEKACANTISWKEYNSEVEK